jgi:hypothetical protein
MRHGAYRPDPAALHFIRGLAIISALAWLLGASPAGAAVTLTSQFRDVTTFATLDRVNGQDPFCSRTETSDQAGGFDQASACQVGEEGNQAVSSAAQLSYLQPELFLAEGSFQASAEIGDEATFAEGFGGSRLMSDFTVDVATEVRLMTTLRADGNGVVNLVFRVNDGTIYLVRSLRNTTETIDEVYTLPPGAYELTLTVGGFGQALPGGGGEPASGSFVASLHFPVSAEVGPASSLAQARAFPGVIPNPTRGEARILPVSAATGPAADLEILDLAGRTVRTLRGVPANGLAWNATDDAGRRLPSGVYVVRDAAGRSSKVTVLP